MKEVCYRLTEDVESWGGFRRTAYGIAAFPVGDAEDGSAVLEFRRMSHDRERLEDLVRRCNQYRLSVVHLEDVVEDFYCE